MRDVLNNGGQFTLFAGPCALEPGDAAEKSARKMADIANRLNLDFYFKVSIDKANRTSATKYRGPGIEKGVQILQQIKANQKVRIITDIHEPWQANVIAQVADIIQIPAFLCRQTDLLAAAAKTGKIINIKKAQFLSAEEMKNVIGKLEYFGNQNILLCERGTCFGYNNLVVDMANLVRMHRFGYPVVFDATHSVQLSGLGADNGNSGASEYVPYLARAAMATGMVDALFMEVHEDPSSALCDGSCMLPLDQLEPLLIQLLKIRSAVGQ